MYAQIFAYYIYNIDNRYDKSVQIAAYGIKQKKKKWEMFHGKFAYDCIVHTSQNAIDLITVAMLLFTVYSRTHDNRHQHNHDYWTVF